MEVSDFFNEFVWFVGENKDTTPLMKANKMNLLRFVQEQNVWNNENRDHRNYEKFVSACCIVEAYCKSQA